MSFTFGEIAPLDQGFIVLLEDTYDALNVPDAEEMLGISS